MLECAATELSSHFYLILKAAEDANFRIQPKGYKNIFFCSMVQSNIVLSNGAMPL